MRACVHVCVCVCVCVYRLKDKLSDGLIDEFIAALEQLNSPELIWKVRVWPLTFMGGACEIIPCMPPSAFFNYIAITTIFVV